MSSNEASSLVGDKGGKGAWTDSEHQKFVDALKLYGKDWPAIAR